MKKLTLILVAILLCIVKSNGQQTNDLSAIKLYNNRTYVEMANSTLPPGVAGRLFRKTTQLINQTGVAEIGYSTFFLAPKLDVISVSEDNAGISKVYLAECELYLSVNRVSFNENLSGGATFNSISKKIHGSGMNENDAIINALNNISANDKELVDFLQSTKQKISNYFKTNCNDVIKQAESALAKDDYSQAIALFYSVPSNAPCYEKALARSEGVYAKYVEDDCNKKLLQLKAFVALAESNRKYYDSAMALMEKINPVPGPCYSQVEAVLDKVEGRLADEQKQQWELEKKTLSDDAEVKKEMYKAMGEINKNYQPASPGNNIIIGH